MEHCCVHLPLPSPSDGYVRVVRNPQRPPKLPRKKLSTRASPAAPHFCTAGTQSFVGEKGGGPCDGGAARLAADVYMFQPVDQGDDAECGGVESQIPHSLGRNELGCLCGGSLVGLRFGRVGYPWAPGKAGKPVSAGPLAVTLVRPVRSEPKGPPCFFFLSVIHRSGRPPHDESRPKLKEMLFTARNHSISTRPTPQRVASNATYLPCLP